jgi:MarR-like DNA-binding transcriptional regulator SgrR of sgrS sRNA
MKRILGWTLASALCCVSLAAVGARRPAHGGSLRLPTDSPIHTLDPIAARWPAEVALAAALYDSPYTLELAGRTRPHLLYPIKALGSGRTLRFKVRQHAVFHDGSPIRAKHVAASLRRLARSQRHGWLLAMIDGSVTSKSGPDGVKLVGTNTLQIRLKSVRSLDLFLHALSSPQAGVVPSAQRAAKGVGSGPFVLRGRKGPDRVLRANRDYFDGPPYISEVRLLGSASRDDHIRRFQLEKADGSLLGVSVHGESPPIKGIALAEGAPTQRVYLLFNTRRRPADELPLRRAVDLALDRRRLSGRVATPLAFPGVKAPTRPDASRARTLIGGLGISSSSRPLVLLVEEADAFGVSLAPLIQRDLAAVGLPVDRVVTSTTETQRRIRSGSWDMRLVTIAPVSPNEVLRTGQVLALGGLGSEARRLVEQAPAAERAELTRASKVLRTQLPLLPLCVRSPRLHYRTRLRGVVYDSNGQLALADIWLRPRPTKHNKTATGKIGR